VYTYAASGEILKLHLPVSTLTLTLNYEYVYSNGHEVFNDLYAALHTLFTDILL